MLVRISGMSGKAALRNGVWRVFSVQLSMKLDLGAVDRVVMEKSGLGVWREVSLLTLGPERIALVECSYAGIPL